MPRYRTLLLLAAASPALAADLPPDLALVPGDAAAFAHVRAADLWRSPAFAQFRAPIEAAGPRLVAAYDKRFNPAPSTLDRVTAVLPAGGQVAPVVVLRMSKPFDRARLALDLQPLEAEYGYRAEIVDNHTFLLGPPESLQAVKMAGKGPGPLTPLVAAAAGKTLTVAVNRSALPADATAGVPPPLQPLAKLKALTITADVGQRMSGEVRLSYADAKDAGGALAAAQMALAEGRRQLAAARAEVGKPLLQPDKPGPAPLAELPEMAGRLFGLGAMAQADEWLKDLPLKQDGADLRLGGTLPDVTDQYAPFVLAGFVGAAMSAFETRNLAGPVGVAVPAPGGGLRLDRLFRSNEAKATNNLKQIGLAMHNYESATGRMPGHAGYANDGKTPLLSWRVAILPYLEQDQLYRQFKLDEPWDSETNKPLAALMPDIYKSPNAPPGKAANATHYQLFVGGGAAWPRGPRGPRLPEITDGTSNTVMVVEAAEPVVWSKPDDIEYGPMKALPKLGANPAAAHFLVLMMDGSVHRKPTAAVEKVLRAAITAAGGEVYQW